MCPPVYLDVLELVETTKGAAYEAATRLSDPATLHPRCLCRRAIPEPSSIVRARSYARSTKNSPTAHCCPRGTASRGP